MSIFGLAESYILLNFRKLSTDVDSLDGGTKHMTEDLIQMSCPLSGLAVTAWVSFSLVLEKRSVDCDKVDIREHPCGSHD